MEYHVQGSLNTKAILLLDQVHEELVGSFRYLRISIFVLIFLWGSAESIANWLSQTLGGTSGFMVFIIGGAGFLIPGWLAEMKRNRARSLKSSFRGAAGFRPIGLLWYDFALLAFVTGIYTYFVSGLLYIVLAIISITLVEVGHFFGERMYRHYKFDILKAPYEKNSVD